MNLCLGRNGLIFNLKIFGQKQNITFVKKINFETVFFETQWNKRRLKQFLKKCTVLLGGDQTRALAENLKHTGYEVSTRAGLSLNIEDLKVPGCKPALSRFTRASLTKNETDFFNAGCHQEHGFGFLTSLWNNCGELLKREVVKCFQNDDDLNPVFLMAFSGARGNLSQIRQLVGLRGLMTDPNNNVVPYGLTSNFREGLSLTEYIVSCSGARKGVIDTALRTATSGYLTRRLVDVAHGIVVERWDCHSQRSLSLPCFDASKGKNNTQNGFQPMVHQNVTKRVTRSSLLSTNQGLLGRVLKQNVLNQHGQICGTVDQEINMALLLKACLPSGLRVRSPCTCDLGDHVCRLCYGWNHDGLLVSLGECVGILACQSIGEPGTQLTMRTFHTGGVFSGESSNALYAPQAGFVFFQKPILGQMAWNAYHNQSGFLTKQNGVLSFVSWRGKTTSHTENQTKKQCHVYVLALPSYSFIFAKHGLKIEAGFLLAELFSPDTCFGHRQDVFAFSSPYEGVFLNTCAQVVKHASQPRENAFWKHVSYQTRFGFFVPFWDLRGPMQPTQGVYEGFFVHKDQTYRPVSCQKTIPPDLSGQKRTLITLGVNKTSRFDFNWDMHFWFQYTFGAKRDQPKPKPGTVIYESWFDLGLDHSYDASLLHLKQIRWRFGFEPMGFSYRPDQNRFMSQFHDTRFWVLGAKKLNMLCDPCDFVFKPENQTPKFGFDLRSHGAPCAYVYGENALVLNMKSKSARQSGFFGPFVDPVWFTKNRVVFEPLSFKIKHQRASLVQRPRGVKPPVLNHFARPRTKKQKPVGFVKNQHDALDLVYVSWQNSPRGQNLFGDFLSGLKSNFKRGWKHAKPFWGKTKWTSFVFDPFYKLENQTLNHGKSFLAFKHKRVLNVPKNQFHGFFSKTKTKPTLAWRGLNSVWFSKTCFFEIQKVCLNSNSNSTGFGKHNKSIGLSQPCTLSIKQGQKRFSWCLEKVSRRTMTLKNPCVFSWLKNPRVKVCQENKHKVSEKHTKQNRVDARKELYAFAFPCLSFWVKTRNYALRQDGKTFSNTTGFHYDQNTFWPKENGFKQSTKNQACDFDFFPWLNFCRPKRKKQVHLHFGLKQTQSLFFQNRFSWCLAHPVNQTAFLNTLNTIFETRNQTKTQPGSWVTQQLFSDLCGVWHMPWHKAWYLAEMRTTQCVTGKSIFVSHAVFARAQKSVPYPTKEQKPKRCERFGFLPFGRVKTKLFFANLAKRAFKHGFNQVRKANMFTQSAKTLFWSHAYVRYGFVSGSSPRKKNVLKTSFFENRNKTKRLNIVQVQNLFKNKVYEAYGWLQKQTDQTLPKTKKGLRFFKSASKTTPLGTGCGEINMYHGKHGQERWLVNFWASNPRAKEAFFSNSLGFNRLEKQKTSFSFVVQTVCGHNLHKPFCATVGHGNLNFKSGETHLTTKNTRVTKATLCVFGHGYAHFNLPKLPNTKLRGLGVVSMVLAFARHGKQKRNDHGGMPKHFNKTKRKRLVFGHHVMKPLVFYEVLSKTRLGNVLPPTVLAKSKTKVKFEKPHGAFSEPRLHRVALNPETHLLQFQHDQRFFGGFDNQKSNPPQTTLHHEPKNRFNGRIKSKGFAHRFGVGTLLPYGFRMQNPAIVFSHCGQIWFLNSKTMILRHGRQFFMPQRCFSFKTHFDFVPFGSCLFRGLSKRVLRGDITQGILKVERLFEMRLDYDLNFGLREALRMGYHAWNGRCLNLLVQRRVILKLNALAQSYALRQIQNVYTDVGVNILDKHVELILKQMTSRARIRRGFRHGFFSGDYVHLGSLNLSLGFCVLNPGLNGLTKTSFLAPGFLSPASFQETKSVLANRSFLAQDDFLSGLKENVVCGRRLNMGLNVLHGFKQDLNYVLEIHTYQQRVKNVAHLTLCKRGAKMSKPKTAHGKQRFKFHFERKQSSVFGNHGKSKSVHGLLRHLKFIQMKSIGKKRQPKGVQKLGVAQKSRSKT